MAVLTQDLIDTILMNASGMAGFAVERALERPRQYEEHPCFGINVDKDKYAVLYQAHRQRMVDILQSLLSPELPLPANLVMFRFSKEGQREQHEDKE